MVTYSAISNLGVCADLVSIGTFVSGVARAFGVFV